jgi:tetratricopeptide (TPR) repeat protein
MESRIKQLRIFEKESPNDDFIIYTIGLELLKSSVSEAEIYFEKNHKLNPNYLANFYQLGKLKLELGKFLEAQSILEEGISLAKKRIISTLKMS